MRKNFQFRIFNFQKGFTLIEILVVVALGALVTTFVTLSFSKVNATEALDKNADLVVSVLNEARSMTLSAVDDTHYGAHLDADRIVLFRGSLYATTTATNVATTLNSQVGIRNISLSGGGANVVFNRLTGATSQYGTLEIYLKGATTTYRTITIGAAGIAERN